LLGQFGAGQKPVLHDGAGQRFDDVVRGGGFHVSRSLGTVGSGVFVSVAQIIAIKSKIVYTSVDWFKGLFKALPKPPFLTPI
jgi:hypothetical protein